MFECIDCYKDTLDPLNGFEDDYSVHNHVWLEACEDPFAGDLCLKCLRDRLDRELQMSDFMLQYEVNNHINQELLDRINNVD